MTASYQKCLINAPTCGKVTSLIARTCYVIVLSSVLNIWQCSINVMLFDILTKILKCCLQTAETEIGIQFQEHANANCTEQCVSLQNLTSSLGSFMPLLMGGGVISALAQGAKVSPAAVRTPPRPADPKVSVLSVMPVRRVHREPHRSVSC